MRSILEQVNELDTLIHQLSKMESLMQSGKWIDAWRECCRLIAAIKRAKSDYLAHNIAQEAKNNEK